jgi:predicted nucleic acid-binding protein
MPVVDSLLATTARCHALTLATRNVGDFLQAEVSVMNPWTDS